MRLLAAPPPLAECFGQHHRKVTTSKQEAGLSRTAVATLDQFKAAGSQVQNGHILVCRSKLLTKSSDL